MVGGRGTHRNWTAWDRVFATQPDRNHPPITTLFMDSEGYLWIPDPVSWERGTTELNVFDPHGRWLGNVALGVYPYWIGENFILSGRGDPDTGVLTIEGYRLDRRGRLGEKPPN